MNINFGEISKRNKIIILVSVAVIILIIALLIWFFSKSKSEPPIAGLVNTNQGVSGPSELPSASLVIPEYDASLVKDKELDAGLRAIAFTFSERFGSYSNEGNFNNVESVNSIMTARMRAWVTNYLIQQGERQSDAVYYGITTKALSVNISKFDENSGRAEVIVTTQRQENLGSTENAKVYYQDLKLDLVNSEQGWKVDSASWL